MQKSPARTPSPKAESPNTLAIAFANHKDKTAESDCLCFFALVECSHFNRSWVFFHLLYWVAVVMSRFGTKFAAFVQDQNGMLCLEVQGSEGGHQNGLRLGPDRGFQQEFLGAMAARRTGRSAWLLSGDTSGWSRKLHHSLCCRFKRLTSRRQQESW